MVGKEYTKRFDDMFDKCISDNNIETPDWMANHILFDHCESEKDLEEMIEIVNMFHEEN